MNFFRNLQRRERLFVVGAGALLVLFLIFKLTIDPMLKRSADLDRQLVVRDELDAAGAAGGRRRPLAEEDPEIGRLALHADRERLARRRCRGRGARLASGARLG